MTRVRDLLVATCCLIAGMGCKHREGNSHGILSRDTMGIVLWEMLKADSYNDFRANMDTNYKHDTAFARLYTNIFDVHHISRTQFFNSYDYYMSQPEVLREMIDSLSDKMNRQLNLRGPQGMGGQGIRNNNMRNYRPGMPNGRPVTSPGHPSFPNAGRPPVLPGRNNLPPGPPSLRPGQGNPRLPPDTAHKHSRPI